MWYFKYFFKYQTLHYIVNGLKLQEKKTKKTFKVMYIYMLKLPCYNTIYSDIRILF